MTMPKPTCRICNRQMTYSKDSDWDAAYWVCEKEHTRNGIGISTAIAHEDAQAAYIAQLEAENTRLQARVTELEAEVANTNPLPIS